MTKKLSDSRQTHIFAVIACLIAASLWGLLWYPLRLLDAQGLPGLWSTLVMYLTGFSLMLPFAIRRSWPENIPLSSVVILALASGWTNLAFILAMIEGTVVRVLLLFYLSPVWTIVLSWCFLREPISRSSAIHLGLAFTGAMLLLWNEQIDIELSYADVMALSSGFAFAVNNLLLRKLGNVSIIHKMTIAWLGVIVLAIAGLILTAEALPSANIEAILWAMLLGGTCMILMTYAAQYGVTHIPLHQSATLFLFEVPVGAISAAILVAEVMTTREWLGGACVMLAAWFSIHNTINHSKNSI